MPNLTQELIKQVHVFRTRAQQVPPGKVILNEMLVPLLRIAGANQGAEPLPITTS